ncbi:MAG: hypothetical protein COB51_05275 [Moraxellaceae bacterium]|nr:MAG: hypothetical protein COB51_05275 [Moraxellaceae bacterium]
MANLNPKSDLVLKSWLSGPARDVLSIDVLAAVVLIVAVWGRILVCSAQEWIEIKLADRSSTSPHNVVELVFVMGELLFLFWFSEANGSENTIQINLKLDVCYLSTVYFLLSA